jgi:hypothetical protein
MDGGRYLKRLTEVESTRAGGMFIKPPELSTNYITRWEFCGDCWELSVVG